MKPSSAWAPAMKSATASAMRGLRPSEWKISLGMKMLVKTLFSGSSRALVTVSSARFCAKSALGCIHLSGKARVQARFT